MKRVDAYRKEQSPELAMGLSRLECLEWKLDQKVSVSQECQDLFPHLLEMPVLIGAIGEEKKHRKLKVGVVFSGGQASGGHNVICGLYRALKHLNEESELIGFLEGPSGIIEGKFKEITHELVDDFINTGGFEMIGSGRTKIESAKQFEKSADVVKTQGLHGLVVIGGDDSNTNAALLAEYFLSKGIDCSVVGVPKTIDGDLKNEWIETSFGFDTATKTYSATIGSILRDSLSAKKYWFFIKLMGRSASHIALECALQTQPNLTLIGEEVRERTLDFVDLVKEIADLVEARAKEGKNYGVVLIPEGLIEFIPQFQKLFQELNHKDGLSPQSKKCLNSLPLMIQEQLKGDLDPHGNVQVSKIETERLFIEAVKDELDRRGRIHQFSAQPIFCGYEGRCCLPSLFDANYCYSLGFVAASLVDQGMSGYMATVRNLKDKVEKWEVAAVPVTSMIHLEERKGKMKPVIKKALVDLEGEIFKTFSRNRGRWRLEDDFQYPGPIQFSGPEELTYQTTFSLQLTPKRVLEEI